jgi:lambda family phage portal protein
MKLFPFGRRSAGPEPQPGTPISDELPAAKRRKFGRSMIAGLFKSSFVDPNDKWGSLPLPIDEFITLRQPALVARSREQWSNNDYMRAFVRRCRQNIVGHHGIRLQAKATLANGKTDKNANDAIEAAWRQWGLAGNCDVTGKYTWRALQALAVEHASRDGEFIFRKVYGADAGPFGFALQAIDPQRLPVRYQDSNFGKNGHFIRQGIEFNRYGKPVAYHFTSTDEWDAYFYYSVSGKGFVRVPADEIIHGFVTEWASQRRGIPWAATSLFRLHHLNGFEDAAVQNARASASKMGFIQYREGFGPEADDSTNVADSINAEPLSFHELPEGAELAEWNPQYPSGEFAAFNKAMLRGAGAGMGVAYNGLANDLEGVNFSSIRDGKVDERDNWKELQTWLIEALCQPVFEEWLKLSLIASLIVKKDGKPLPASRVAAYKDAHWQPRRWEWIDPKSDATAKVTEVRGGFTSPSQVIRERGHDPETVFKEIADDMALMKASGIPETIVNIIFGVAPAPEAAPSKGDVSQGKEPKQ